jgi:folate-binding protein YgfZ
VEGKTYVLLEERGIVAVAGDDRKAFLQGLVSNDVGKVAPDRAVYAALLTPQGKYLHDFFMAELGGAILLDCERLRAADLARRLGVYKLRAKVSIADRSAEFEAAALIGSAWASGLGPDDGPGRAAPFAGGLVFADPRLARLGGRALLPAGAGAGALAGAGFAKGERREYENLRIRLGVPDGSRDLVVEKSILLENGFDELNGVDWNKGCFMGQELTARTRYRGLVKKRLLPVEIEGPAPPPGTPLTLGGRDAGEMRSASDGLGLALVRLDCLAEAEGAGAPLLAGEARLKARKPDWASF